QPTQNIIDNVVDLGVAAAQCAAGLTGVGQALSAALEIAAQIRELINNIQSAIDKAQSGQSAAATAAALKAANNVKATIVAGVDAFKENNPVGKALAISKCIEKVLGALDNICGRSVSNSGNCSSTLVRITCIGIGVAKTGLAQANALIDKADASLK